MRGCFVNYVHEHSKWVVGQSAAVHKFFLFSLVVIYHTRAANISYKVSVSLSIYLVFRLNVIPNFLPYLN